jgi:hypothetical protein
MFPVRYELGLYIAEDDILHSHRRENLNSYIVSSILRLLIETFQLPVIANIVSSPLTLVTLMMEVTRSSEKSVLTRVTRHRIAKEGILYSHRRDIFQSLVTPDFPSSLLLFTLIMEVIMCSEKSVLTRVTRLHIPDDCILQVLISH